MAELPGVQVRGEDGSVWAVPMSEVGQLPSGYTRLDLEERQQQEAITDPSGQYKSPFGGGSLLGDIMHTISSGGSSLYSGLQGLAPSGVGEAVATAALPVYPLAKSAALSTVDKLRSIKEGWQQGDPGQTGLAALSVLNPLAPNPGRIYQTEATDPNAATGQVAAGILPLAAGAVGMTGGEAPTLPITEMTPEAVRLGQLATQARGAALDFETQVKTAARGQYPKELTAQPVVDSPAVPLARTALEKTANASLRDSPLHPTVRDTLSYGKAEPPAPGPLLYGPDGEPISNATAKPDAPWDFNFLKSQKMEMDRALERGGLPNDQFKSLMATRDAIKELLDDHAERVGETSGENVLSQYKYAERSYGRIYDDLGMLRDLLDARTVADMRRAVTPDSLQALERLARYSPGLADDLNNLWSEIKATPEPNVLAAEQVKAGHLAQARSGILGRHASFIVPYAAGHAMGLAWPLPYLLGRGSQAAREVLQAGER